MCAQTSLTDFIDSSWTLWELPLIQCRYWSASPRGRMPSRVNLDPSLEPCKIRLWGIIMTRNWSLWFCRAQIVIHKVPKDDARADPEGLRIDYGSYMSFGLLQCACGAPINIPILVVTASPSPKNGFICLYFCSFLEMQLPFLFQNLLGVAKTSTLLLRRAWPPPLCFCIKAKRQCLLVQRNMFRIFLQCLLISRSRDLLRG